MPILDREPCLYPETLLETATEVAGGEMWWGLYTLPRHEKQLMRRLRVLKLPFYAPLVAKRNRSPNGRVRVSHVPLFAGYVFLWGDEAARYTARTTNCVSRCLPVPHVAELTADLIRIHRLIEIGEPLTPEARLQPGQHVRIRAGALMGFEGTVIRRAGETRLLVAVNFLQQGASVRVDDCLLEALD